MWWWWLFTCVNEYALIFWFTIRHKISKKVFMNNLTCFFHNYFLHMWHVRRAINFEPNEYKPLIKWYKNSQTFPLALCFRISSFKFFDMIYFFIKFTQWKIQVLFEIFECWVHEQKDILCWYEINYLHCFVVEGKQKRIMHTSSKLSSTQHITSHQKSMYLELQKDVHILLCSIVASSNCIDDIKSDERAPTSKQDALHKVSMPSMHGPIYPT